MNTAGERVEQERKAKGWSQQLLADKVTRLGYKITQPGIDKIEKRASRRPRCSRELAIALGVTLEWLLEEKGPKHPQAKKGKSLDEKMGFLEADDFDRLYEAFESIIDNTLQKSQPK